MWKRKLSGCEFSVSAMLPAYESVKKIYCITHLFKWRTAMEGVPPEVEALLWGVISALVRAVICVITINYIN
jgi:hypothetical protein